MAEHFLLLPMSNSSNAKELTLDFRNTSRSADMPPQSADNMLIAYAFTSRQKKAITPIVHAF